MKSKRCVTCNKTKLLESFNLNHATKDGHQSSCRQCTKGYDRAYLENPVIAQKARDRANKHYWDNREKKQAQVSKYQFDRKMKAVNLFGGKCQECPEIHPAALQFHHRDPSQKVFSISSKTLAMPKKYPWEIILLELDKCDLLCSNCHAKLHSKWDQWISKGG